MTKMTFCGPWAAVKHEYKRFAVCSRKQHAHNLQRFPTTRLHTTAAAAGTASNDDAPSRCKVVVVGAGIIGLTTAIRLSEAGHQVVVAACETPRSILNRDSTMLRDSPQRLYVSSGSGGYWMPFHADGKNMEQWCLETYDELERQAASGVPGVAMHEGFILCYSQVPPVLPFYAQRAQMQIVTHKDDARVPAAYACGLRMKVPIAVMDEYLPYLEDRVNGSGVETRLLKEELDVGSVGAFGRSVFGVASGHLIVVNCTGMGAKQFSADDACYPGRGVIVRVRRPLGAPNYFITENDEDGLLSRDGLLAYCLPRGEEYSLGGTIFGDDWRTSVEGSEADAVLRRCATLIPGIDEWGRSGVWCGLRPMRKGGIRLEVERVLLDDDLTIVGNYGYGGSGLTTSWGVGNDIVRLVAQL